MDGQFDKLEELIYVESHLSNTSAKYYGEVTQQMLKYSDYPGSSNGTGLFQTLVGLKIRDVYEQIMASGAQRGPSALELSRALARIHFGFQNKTLQSCKPPSSDHSPCPPSLRRGRCRDRRQVSGFGLGLGAGLGRGRGALLSTLAHLNFGAWRGLITKKQGWCASMKTIPWALAV